MFNNVYRWEYGGKEVPEFGDPNNKEAVMTMWTLVAYSEDCKALHKFFKHYLKEHLGEKTIPEDLPKEMVWLQFSWTTQAYDIDAWRGNLIVMEVDIEGDPSSQFNPGYHGWIYNTDTECEQHTPWDNFIQPPNC